MLVKRKGKKYFKYSAISLCSLLEGQRGVTGKYKRIKLRKSPQFSQLFVCLLTNFLVVHMRNKFQFRLRLHDMKAEIVKNFFIIFPTGFKMLKYPGIYSCGVLNHHYVYRLIYIFLNFKHMHADCWKEAQEREVENLMHTQTNRGKARDKARERERNGSE